MKRVGAYEAKTHLPRLLEEVSSGERIVITKHGAPVAILSPASAGSRRPISETIAEIRSLRHEQTLGDETLRELIEEGRR